MKQKICKGKIYVTPMPILGVLKHFVETFILQFISLIGGRVCNPRQQHALNIYLFSLSDYKRL